MADKGTKVVGDPSLEKLNPGDIVSVGQNRPPQGPDGKPIINSGTNQPDQLLDNLGQQKPGGPDGGQPGGPEGTPTNGTNPAATQKPIEGNQNPNTAPIGQKPEGQLADPPQQQLVDSNGKPVQSPPAPENTPAPQTNPWDTVLATIKTDVGVEFNSKDQFVNELKQFNEYKKDPYGFLPPEIKAHHDFIKAGGDTQEFYRLKAVDFKGLPDKEILFQSHLRNKPDHAKDPEFARMYFDKQFDNQYSILTGPKKTPGDFVNDEEVQDIVAYQNYEQEYVFAEKSLKFDSDSKRNELVSWQEKSTSPAQAPGTGMTQEDADKYRNEYMTLVEQVKGSFTGEEMPVSDKPEENLKFGLNDQIKPAWEKDLANPTEFFNELGLTYDGKLDINKLARASFIYRIWDKLGPIATKLILESQARQTVTGRQINAPIISGSPEPGSVQGDDELKEVADLIIQKDFKGRRPV